MAVTPHSFIDYVASASQTNFAIIRPRLSDSHLRVFQNGVLLVLTSDYTIVADDVVLNVGATSGDEVRIERQTPQTTRVVDFTAGGTLTEADLDNSALQSLYLAQEALDQVLQLKDTGVAIVDFAPQTLIEDTTNYHQNAATRLTPAMGVQPKTQQWIRVDAGAQEVNLAPGVYRIDITMYAVDQIGGVSRLSACISTGVEPGSTITYAVSTAGLVDIAAWVSGTHVLDLTSETSFNFKAAVTTAAGDIDVAAPCQWVITRLGGDPADN